MRRLLQFEPAFLKSKIARRLFTLFILSAMLPMVVVIVLALGHLTNLLEQIGYRELETAAKNYGMSTIERLRTLEDALDALALEINRKKIKSNDLASIGPQLHFRTVQVGAAVSTASLTPAAQTQLIDGGTIITIEGTEQPRIFMSRRLHARHADRRILAAELDPTFLFGEHDTLPYRTDVCVVGSPDRALFCSRTLPQTIVAAAERRVRDAPHIGWHEGGAAYVASHWTLFIEGRYASPSWTVIASRPRSDLFALLERFWWVVVPGLVVSLLLVVLLTVSQVRRRLVPIESLTAATQRIGNQNFSEPLDIRSGDEFEQVAHALNAMADRLNRQFSALTTWSEVDRVIVADPSIDRVLEAILRRLPDVVHADVLGVTVLEDQAQGRGRIYARAATDTRIVVERIDLAAGEIESLMRQQKVTDMVCGAGGVPPYLALFAQLGANSTCSLPVVISGNLVTIITVGYRGEPTFAEEDRVHLRNIADRVAVALMAADRERQLYHQAHFDPLTGLPNRLYVENRLAENIAHAQRERQRLALLFIDLDRFKDINDTLGHVSGDHLLRQVAARLQGCVRAADTVARLGGDEFTIILGNIGSPRGAQMVAENVIRVLSEPVLLEGRETFVSCSIGITLYPDDGRSSDELLRKADTAMYRAKQTGRARFVFFEEQMNIEALDRVALEQDLRRAIARDEFVLHFQPQVDLRSGNVIGAEMLVRWIHPDRGLLAPDQFIGIAENAGLIETIGELLLRKACLEHRRWREAGFHGPRLAVNVSTRQLRQGNFWEVVQRTLDVTAMPAASLELEITESLLLDNAAEVVANFSRLEGMGVKVAIDDFGTGYSSLAYLKRLPIDVVKIDRAFMRDAPDSDDAATIVKAIVAMAQSLRKQVIAEGVENEAQIAFLLNIGCHYAQGYALSRPLAADDFMTYLRGRTEARLLRAQ